MLVLVLSIVAIGALIDDALTSESDVTNRPESNRGYELLHERLPGPPEPGEYVVISSAAFTVDDAAFRRKARSLFKEGRARQIDVDGRSYLDSGDPSLVSRDRHAALIPLYLGGDATDTAEQLVDLAHDSSDRQFEITITGNETARHRLRRADPARPGEGRASARLPDRGTDPRARARIRYGGAASPC